MDLETAARAYHDEPTPERAEAVVRAGEAFVTSAVDETPAHPVYGEWEERFTVGLAALYEALMRWEPGVGNGSFASFAYMRVKGAVLTHLNRALFARRYNPNHRWSEHLHLDAPNGSRGARLYDLVPAPNTDDVEQRDTREVLLRLLDVLMEKEEGSLVLYYFRGVSQEVQAEEQGVSQSAIAHRLSGAYRKLSETPLAHYTA